MDKGFTEIDLSDLSENTKARDFLWLLHNICKRYNLSISKFVPLGPNGSPSVEFHGDVDDLFKMLTEKHKLPPEDVSHSIKILSDSSERE